MVGVCVKQKPLKKGFLKAGLIELLLYETVLAHNLDNNLMYVIIVILWPAYLHP